MGNYYNDYGFSEINPTNITFDVPGIEDKTIGNSYTLQEEYRDWRRVVKQHITNEKGEISYEAGTHCHADS